MSKSHITDEMCARSFNAQYNTHIPLEKLDPYTIKERRRALEAVIPDEHEENSKLRAENAELRKLVKTPVYAFTESEWKEWVEQHPILQHNS